MDSEGVLVGAALLSSWRLLANADIDLSGKLTCSYWFFEIRPNQVVLGPEGVI